MDFLINGATSKWKAAEGGLTLAALKALKTNDPRTCKTLFFRVMKLTGMTLLVACMQVSARSNRQRMAISAKNARLQKLFSEIERKTSYTFFYDVAILNSTTPVTIEMLDTSIEARVPIAGGNITLKQIEKVTLTNAKGESELPIKIYDTFFEKEKGGDHES